MNNKQLVVLFGILFAIALAGPSEDESKTTVEQAANILQELLDDSVKSLNDLNNAWGVKKPILLQQISTLEQSLQKKLDECEVLDQTQANREKELQDAEGYVEWLNKRIQENITIIKNLLESRCAQNGNFIEGLKNDKLALKLVQFLRKSVDSKEDLSFVQRKSFNAKLNQFLAVYKTGNLQALIQLEKQIVESEQYNVDNNQDIKERTSEQIGQNHIDNNQADLDLENFQNGDRKGWIQLKKELLDLLNSLESTIKIKMQKAQDDEVNSNTAATDFKIQLEHENDVYEKELVKWDLIVSDLKLAIAFDKDNVTRCRSEEGQFNGQLNEAKQDLAQETQEYEHSLSNFEQEISIFREVIEQYIPSVLEQGEDFKERVEDYSDNQTFDNGDYNQREVPQIDLINSF